MKSKLMVLFGLVMLSTASFAGEIKFEDPKGDDNGPGSYIYPTDRAYPKGSFDLTGFEVKFTDKKVNFTVDMASKLEDPWGMGVGFAVQMIFIFIDTGDGGHTDVPKGLNVTFAEGDAWDKLVILSPQQATRVKSEIKEKAADFADDILVPSRTSGRSKSIKGSVKLEDLGGGDPSTWGYQVVVQSNEGFPSDGDLLTRKVNEYEGQHRFGGGNDGNCDPHVIDVLAGSASGGEDEVAAQHAMLKFSCDDEGKTDKPVTLKMIRK